MLISIDWIKDFVKLPDNLTPKQLGEKFTLATAEVEDVISVGEHLEKITVVQVLEKERHPEADKLNLVTFTNGTTNFKVVCGASNVVVGMKTAYAPLGITLPNGLTLEPKKIRGVLSEGMLCSEEELGFKEESDGILELPSDTKLGLTMLEVFNETKDVILDVDNKSLTHRPDLWGHYGLAREFATVFKNKLNDPFSKEWADKLKATFPTTASPIKLNVDSNSSCLGYFGICLDGVKVEASPSWMQKRLKTVGLRPINNIVDISNYVMLELGIPLHIFDRKKIEGGNVFIKQLGTTATFKTLDDVDRSLVSDDTVICDSQKPLVLAGIMGGLNSGVDESTTEVFIEVANWKAALVRKTSTRLGLRTDSSSRYEKTLDSLSLEKTMLRAVEYILKLCPQAKVISKLEYAGPNLSEIKTLKIKSSASSIATKLGSDISFSQMKEIFESLAFEVIGNESSFEVVVPSFRATKDIECESCLVEEIGRIIGFDNIAPISPLVDVKPVNLTDISKMHRKLRDFFVYHASAHEVMTYPMVGEALLKKAMYPVDRSLELINALSKDQELMRTSMIPGFLEAVSKNAKNGDQFKFFELGRTYHSDPKNFCTEKSMLGVVYYSEKATPFMDLVNDTSRALNATSIGFQLNDRNTKFKSNVVDESWAGIHPFEFYNIRVQGKMDGVIFSVHPIVLKAYKIKGHVSIALVDLSGVESKPMKDKTKYKPLSKFPGSSFDCTVICKKDIPASAAISALDKLKIKELTSSKILDIFNLEDGVRAVTLRSHFLDTTATLTGEFITEASNKIVSTLAAAGFELKK